MKDVTVTLRNASGCDLGSETMRLPNEQDFTAGHLVSMTLLSDLHDGDTIQVTVEDAWDD